MRRWERRERKLKKRRERMRLHGQGLKKVVLPIIARKAEEAKKRAAQGKGRPQTDAGVEG